METRKCTCCGLMVDLSGYYPSSKWQCKSCLKKKAESKREKNNQYYRDRRAKDPDEYKRWYAKNKERKAEYWQEWYSKNKDSRSVSYKEWAKENNHVINALVAKRTAAKKKATLPCANQDKIKAIYKEAARLTKETGIRHEVDHIVPLQGETVCGLHWEGNLQILTKTENIRKSNKLLEKYL